MIMLLVWKLFLHKSSLFEKNKKREYRFFGYNYKNNITTKSQ